MFREHGPTVLADTQALADPVSPSALVAAAGRVDVLIANLAVPAPSTPAVDVSDEEWRHAFAHMVDPLPRLLHCMVDPDCRLA